MNFQKKRETVTIYTTPHYVSLFELGRLRVKLVALALPEMVKHYMAHGREHDICIMPFVSQFKALLSAFRAKNLIGTVVFLSESPVDGSIMLEVHQMGALLMDSRGQKPDIFRFFLLFLIKNQQMIHAWAGKRPDDGENGRFTENLHQTYYREPPLKQGRGEGQGPSSEKNIRAILAEALDQPEVMPFETLYGEKSLYGANFTFNFSVTLPKEKREASFSCMATLHTITAISQQSRKRMLCFNQFHPEFSIRFLQKRAMKLTREELSRALNAKGDDDRFPDEVKSIFNLGGLNRTCFLLPAAQNGADGIGFIPLSDAFIQSRQFFRIEPSAGNPIQVIVGSFFSPSREVRLIDISERGISFMSDYLFKKNCELTLFLSWETHKMVCYGITRFSATDEETGKHKIGAELYLHPDECAKLRRYVFERQIDIMNTLREDYS